MKAEKSRLGEMLPLAHIGLAVGFAKLIEVSVAAATRRRAPGYAYSQNPDDAHAMTSPGSGWALDYRWLLLGSILPDLVDKPLGHLLLSNVFSGGRILTHTLIFWLLLALAGSWLQLRRRKPYLLILAAGCAIHLILDQMWRDLPALLYPFFGWTFPAANLENYWWRMLQSLVSNPVVLVTELAGALVLAAIMIRLLRQRRLKVFFTTGVIR